MNNIIEFPIKAVRNRDTLDILIKETLQQALVPEDISDLVFANMNTFIELLIFEHSISLVVPEAAEEPLREALDGLNVALDKRMGRLIAERLQMEIKYNILLSD